MKRLTTQVFSLKGRDIEIGIIGLIDLLRETSIEVVETIDEWEKCQVNFPDIIQFTWNKQNYLEKMCHDLDFLDSVPQIKDWLEFDLIGNPFIVPPEAVSSRVKKDALIIFGRPPQFEPPSTTKVKKNYKSPYLAPIINDPEVFANLSAKSKLDKAFGPNNNEVKVGKQPGKDGEEVNLYQCFISTPLLRRIRGCLKKLSGNELIMTGSTMFSAFQEFSREDAHSNHSTISLQPSGSLDQEKLFEDRPNPYLFETRKSNFLSDVGNSTLLHPSETKVDYMYEQLSQSTKIWAPHELNLQRQVERRGGELFVLTVAGTKGRIKDPKRRTRFERLETDMQQLQMLSDHFGMIVEDLESELLRLSQLPEFAQGFQVDNPIIAAYLHEIKVKTEAQRDITTRLEFTKTLHNHFKLVAENGTLTTLESQRQRHQLEDGQAREQDQLLSMKLEENMVKKIQRLIRRSFGRALRKAEKARRERAAIKIQSAFRMSRVNKLVKNRIKQLRLALMVQRLYRIKSAEKLRKQLLLEAMQRQAAQLIQRVYRGCRGRRRLQLKRQFIRALNNAKRAVSLVEMKPSDVEYLADAIEDYVRDYSVKLPIHLLTLLRGILYLFNGTNSEVVLVCNDDGYQEKKFIHSGAASWQSIKLVLRRKGRFLRRMRALIQNSCLPNPTKIVMSDDCKAHLKAFYENIKIDYFQNLGKAQHCVEQLFLYVTNVYVAFGLQSLFPEYFEPGLPSWFRALMRIREQYDRAEMMRKLETNANRRIEDVKKMHAKEGKKYAHISHAVQKNTADYEHAKFNHEAKLRKYETFMKELDESEQRQVLTLDAISRAKSLARDVSEGDLKEYMKAALIPDEEHIKNLQYTLDAKTIALIQAKTELIQLRETIQKNQGFRDFDKVMSVKNVMELSCVLGKIKGDLLILLESWTALVNEIGGVQYVKDLRDEKLFRYETIKFNAQNLLRQRREIIEEIEKDLAEQYHKMYQFVLDTNALMIGKKWDKPNPVEWEHEDLENRECCKRDYDLEFRKRRQMEIITVKEVFPWMPMIVILDAKLPPPYIKLFHESLKKYKFQLRDFEEILLQAQQSAREREFAEYASEHPPARDPSVTAMLKTSAEDGSAWEQAKKASFIPMENHSPVAMIHKALQDVINRRENIILVANRGFHKFSYLSFDSFIHSLDQVLIPAPRVAYIGGQESFRSDPNFDRLQLSHPFLEELIEFRWKDHHEKEISYEKISSYDSLYGKYKRLSDYIRSLLFNKPKTSYGMVIPSYYQTNFMNDFKEFCLSLKNGIKPGQSIDMSSEEFRDLLLAHNLSIIWKLIPAHYTNWSLEDVRKGARELRHFLSRITFQRLCDYFDLKIELDPEDSEIISDRLQGKPSQEGARHFFFKNAHEVTGQLLPNDSYKDSWRELHRLDGYKNTFRYLLVAWIQTVRELISLESVDLQKSHPYDYYINPTPLAISLFLENRSVRDIEIANIFNKLLETRVIYRKDSPVWKLYYDKDCMDSLSTQSLGSVVVGNAKALEQAAKDEAANKEAAIKQSEGKSTAKGNDSVPRRQSMEVESFVESNSDVIIYHNGEEIYLELTLYLDEQFLRKTFDEKSLKLFADLGMLNSDPSSAPVLGGASSKKAPQGKHICRFMTQIRSDDLVQQLQPNYTEIFEGNLQKIMKAAARDYYATLSNWACLDSIGGQLELSLVRARYLVLSKLGVVAGYFVRLEVYEEKFGEIQILIFGLDKAVSQKRAEAAAAASAVNGANGLATTESSPADTAEPEKSMIYQFRVRKNEVNNLLVFCDDYTEKDKLEAFDSLAMAYIYTDRLAITPSQNWYLFLLHGELLPKAMSSSIQLSTRFRRGPGRLVGSQLLNLKKLFFQKSSASGLDQSTDEADANDKKVTTLASNAICQKYMILMTIYEINSPNSLHELRIVFYHFFDGKTVEYRISAMERMMIFKDSEPVLNQIMEKIRLVYTNVQLTTRERVMMEVPELIPGEIDRNNDLLVKEYEVEGDTQYEIALKMDDEEDEDEDGDNSSLADSQSHQDRSVTTASQSLSKREKEQQKDAEDSQFGFALYFDRSCIRESYGNLVVSVILEVGKRGFTYIVYDPRSFTEVSRFIPFAQMARMLGKSLDDIEQDLGNLDESVGYDLIDECLSLVELDDNDDEGLILYVQGDTALVSALKDKQEAELNDEDEDSLSKRRKSRKTAFLQAAEQQEDEDDEVMVLARLKELPEEIVALSKGKRREAAGTFRITLEILKCEDLARQGMLGLRNAFCIVRLNMREIGRTGVVKGTLSPVWSKEKSNVFTMHFGKESMLLNASIEIEVFDSDAKGIQTDYLGHVKLSGDSLFQFLERNTEVSFDLQRSKRISDHENRHVKGKILLVGKKTVINNNKNNSNVAVSQSGSNELRESQAGHHMVRGKDVLVDPANPLNPSYKSFGLYFASLEHSLFQVGQKTGAATSLFKTLTLAEHLSFFIVIYFNSFEVYRFNIDPAAISADPNRHYAPKEHHFDLDPVVPVEFRVPDSFPISICELKIAFFMKHSRARPELLGTTLINGMQLKELMKDSLDKKPSASHATLTKGLPHVKELEIKTSHGEGKHAMHEDGKILICPTVFRQMPATYKITIKAGRNLPKADLFGKSDPFVKVYWNKKYLGQTEHVNNTINPNWAGKNEEFELIVPVWLSVDQCELELQVFDYDKFSESDLLGVRILQGEELKWFISLASIESGAGGGKQSKAEVQELQKRWKEHSAEYNASHRTVHFQITKSPVLSQSVAPRGDIEIAVQSIPFHSLPHSFYSHRGLPFSSPDNQEKKATAETKRAEKEKEKEVVVHWLSERDANYSLVEKELSSRPTDLEFFYHTAALSAYSYRLYVISAKGLANADVFGKSDPFVKIWFNGRKLGFTRVISDTLDPVWNEFFDFSLASGQSLESCYLEFEIYDEDNNKESEFLGSLFLDGKKIIELIGQTHINRDLKNDQYSFLPFFELQKLNAAKDNRYVRGFIQIGIERSQNKASLEAIHDFHQSMEMNALEDDQTINVVELEEPRSVHDKSTTNLYLQIPMSYMLIPSEQGGTSVGTISSLNAEHNLYLFILLNGQLWYTLKGRLVITPFQKTHFEVRWTFNENIKTNNGFLVVLPEQIPLESNILQFFLMTEVDHHTLNANDHPILPSLFAANYSFLSGTLLTGKTLSNFLQAKDWEENMNETNFQQNISLCPLEMVTNWSEYLHQVASFQPANGIAPLPSYLLCRCEKRQIKRMQIYLNSFVPVKKKLYDVELIQTPLPEGQARWGYRFGKGEVRGTRGDGEEDSSEEEEDDEDEDNGIDEQERDRALIRLSVMQNPRLTKLLPARAKKTEEVDEAEDEEAVVEVRRRKFERAPMDFTLTVRARMEEEHRVYWRGKLLPKNAVFANEKQKKAVLASRASRLLRTKDINELEVMAEVHYLEEFGETTEVSDELPLCVREIVSIGPGLIDRVFRLELLTNTGILLGTADIEDSKQDFLRCIGSHSNPFLYHTVMVQPRDQLNMQEIFEHVAKERLVFDMMSAGDKKKEKDESNNNGKGRREGIVMNHAENADVVSGSVITIIRDEMNTIQAHLVHESVSAVRPGSAGAQPVGAPAAVKTAAIAHRKKTRTGSVPTVAADDAESVNSMDSVERLANMLLPDQTENLVGDLGNQSSSSDEDEEEEGEDEDGAPISRKALPRQLKDEVKELFHSKYSTDNDRLNALLADPTNRLLRSFKKHWTRVYTKTQRITGKPFRSIIFFSGIHPAYLQTYKLPNGLDKYFYSFLSSEHIGQSSFSPEELAQLPKNFQGLQELIVFICCVDTLNKKVYEMRVFGKQLIPWLLQEFPYNHLGTKFRRTKFCALLVSYITLTYLPNEDFRVHFLPSFLQHYSSTPAPDLLEEDEDEDEEEEDGEGEGRDDEERGSADGEDEGEEFLEEKSSLLSSLPMDDKLPGDLAEEQQAVQEDKAEG